MTSVMQRLPTGVLVGVPPLLSGIDDPILLRVGLGSRHQKRSKLHLRQEIPKPTGIEDLPDEVLVVVVDQNFSPRDFCSLSLVSSRYRQLASSDVHWEIAYMQQYGNITGVTRDAALLAKSWKELFRCKTVNDKKVEPRLSPCSYELSAVLQRIAGEQAATQTGGVIFLLDGSGSVSQDDFDAMTDFVAKAVPVLLEKAPTSKVGVMQFSNDVHIQLPLVHLNLDKCAGIMTDMVRMHGGTDVALAIHTASEHMQTALPAGGLRTLIMLSDGRIDKYQGRLAVEAAQTMQTEQAEASIYAFGVGSAVDRTELDRIVSASGCTDADNRYMALAVQPENLWA